MIKYIEPAPQTFENMFLLLVDNKPLLVSKNIVVIEKMASKYNNTKIVKIPIYVKPIDAPNGEYQNNSPLCYEDVIEIFFDTNDYEIIAKKYHISKSVVSSIKTAKTWTEITIPLLAKEMQRQGFPPNTKIPNCQRTIGWGLRQFEKYFIE